MKPLELAQRALGAAGGEMLAHVTHERSLTLRFAANRPTQATAVDDLTVELAVVREGHVGRAATNSSDEASLAAWPVSRVNPSSRIVRDRQVRHFNLLDQTRAFENQVVWVSANQCGSFGRLRFPGRAKVVDPDGRILARTGARSGLALAQIDARRATATAREGLSHLLDRRPSAYAPPPGSLAPA